MFLHRGLRNAPYVKMKYCEGCVGDPCAGMATRALKIVIFPASHGIPVFQGVPVPPTHEWYRGVQSNASPNRFIAAFLCTRTGLPPSPCTPLSQYAVTDAFFSHAPSVRHAWTRGRMARRPYATAARTDPDSYRWAYWPSRPTGQQYGVLVNGGSGEGQCATDLWGQLDSPSRTHQFASLTVQARPPRSIPWSPAMAALAAPRSGISTNPKPYGCPVSRSVITSIVSTSPIRLKELAEVLMRCSAHKVANKDVHTKVLLA